jgi:hypothetical protein
LIHVACGWFVQADVARLLLSSASAGVYHLPSPDPVQNLLINSVAGITPTDGAPAAAYLLLSPLPLLLLGTAAGRMCVL